MGIRHGLAFALTTLTLGCGQAVVKQPAELHGVLTQVTIYNSNANLGVNVSLDGSRGVFIAGDNHYAVALEVGSKHVVRAVIDSGRGQRGGTFEAEFTVPPSGGSVRVTLDRIVIK